MGKASRRKKERKILKEIKVKKRFNYKLPLIVGGIGLFALLYIKSDYNYIPKTKEKNYIALTKDEREQIYQTVKPKTDSLALELHKKGYGIIKNVEVKVRDRKNFYEFFNNEDISDKINEAKEAIEHALDFWEHPKLNKPVIKFVVSNNPKEIENIVNNYDIVKIYPLKDSGEQIFLDLFFKTESDTIRGELSYEEQKAGLISCKIDIKVLKDSLQVNSYRAGVKWNLSLDEFDILETPPIEVLHLQFAPYTHNNIQKKINELFKETGKINDNIVNDWIYNEELITHAIGQLWFEQYNKDKNLGYIIDSLYSRKGMWGNKEVRLIKEKIKNIGIEKAIDLYIENPNELFK